MEPYTEEQFYKIQQLKENEIKKKAETTCVYLSGNSTNSMNPYYCTIDIKNRNCEGKCSKYVQYSFLKHDLKWLIFAISFWILIGILVYYSNIV